MGVQANGSVARFVERRPVSSGGRELEKEEEEIDCRLLRRRGIELEVLLPKRTPDGNQQLTSTPIPEQSLSPFVGSKGKDTMMVMNMQPTDADVGHACVL